jgi:excisionase family DNA binding protein
MGDRLHTRASAAEYLNTSTRSIDRWVMAGRLPTVFLDGGRTKRFRESALDGLITTTAPARRSMFGRAVAVA